MSAELRAERVALRETVLALAEKWESEGDVHAIDGEYGIAEGLRIAYRGLRDALDGSGKGPCPECGGLKGAHGLVHARHNNGGGSNRPCSRRAALSEPAEGRHGPFCPAFSAPKAGRFPEVKQQGECNCRPAEGGA